MIGQAFEKIALHEGTHAAVMEMIGIKCKGIDIEANGIAHAHPADGETCTAWEEMAMNLAPLVVMDLTPGDMEKILVAGRRYYDACVAASDGDTARSKTTFCYEYVDVMAFLWAKADEIIERAAEIGEVLELGWNPSERWSME